MHIWLGNNTRYWHAGSEAVISTLDRWLEPIGVLGTDDIEKYLPWDQVYLVVVNGEGTMHDNAPKALKWLSFLKEAKRRNIKTALVNTVWQNMNADVSFIDFVSARDPWSADLLGCDWYLDVSSQFFDDELLRCSEVQDIMKPFIGKFWGAKGKQIARDLAGVDVIEYPVPKHSLYNGICRLRKECTVYYTGEFHGVIMAGLAGVPVVKYPGNTWKIEALVAASGIDVLDIREANIVKEAIQNYEKTYYTAMKFRDWLTKETIRARELKEKLDVLYKSAT